jgi:hypothetical protein
MIRLFKESGGRRSLRRSLLAPLLMIVIAGALWQWFEGEAKRQNAALSGFVLGLCHDADKGLEEGLALVLQRSPSSFVAESCWEAIVQSLAGSGAWTCDITRGDHAIHGDGTATHIATIFVNQRPALGLRLAHEGRPPQVTIIGCWREESTESRR